MVEYDGTLYDRDVIKAYRKKFAVHHMKAVAELQLLGVSLTKEQIDREKTAEKHIRNCKGLKRQKGRRFVNRKLRD